jgi:hypothetical protein
VTALAGLDRWYRAPVPAERLAVLRVLVVGYALGFLVVRTPHLLDVARLADVAPDRWEPVGPLVVLDRAPASGAVAVVLLVTVLAGAGALVGWRWRLTGPVLAVGFLALTSHRSSWGQIFHTENLVALHLIVLALAPASVAWSLDARRARHPAPVTTSGWPVRLAAVVVVVAYVLAGVAKLRVGGVEWLVGDALRHHVAHDNLRKALVGDVWSPLGGWAVGQGWWFPPMAAATVAVELGAPLALLGGRWRTVWVAAAWGFHVGVLALMAIVFPYQLLGIAFAPFLPLERLPEWWRRRRSRRAPDEPDGARPTVVSGGSGSPGRGPAPPGRPSGS